MLSNAQNVEAVLFLQLEDFQYLVLQLVLFLHKQSQSLTLAVP